MQTLQSVNDTMNIIFDPNIEGLSLLDFVLVEENDRKFLGQVTEVKSDKYELNKNVATLKILYSINAFDEIVEYGGYTPTRDAHVELYNQKEIEGFINEGKTVFNAGLNPKTMLPLDFNVEFFKNSPVILADKLDELHKFYLNISDKLADFSNVIIFDYTGHLFVENSIRLRLGVDFKLPLNHDTLSYIWDIALSNASLETQAVCEDIFNEVKAYSKTTEFGFIPYDNFLRVIEAQYRETPITELLVLKNRLNKYQQSKIFAQNKEELEIIPKVTRRERITVLDFSYIESVWHRAFSEYIFTNLKEDSFVLLRLNEDNSNQTLIEKIYDENNTLNIIPSFSYGYRRLTSVLEYAKNFVFMPTLSTSHNFGYVNNVISNLTKNYASFFGEDTKYLIFKIQNMPVEFNRFEPEEKKVSKKIKLKGLSRYSGDRREEEEISEYKFDKDDEIANEVLNKEEDSSLSIMDRLYKEPDVIEIEDYNPSSDEEIIQEIAPKNENIPQEPEQPETEPEKIQNDPVKDIINEDELDLFDQIIDDEKKEESDSAKADIPEEKETKEKDTGFEEILQEDEVKEEDTGFEEILQDEEEKAEDTDFAEILQDEEEKAEENSFVEIDYDENKEEIEAKRESFLGIPDEPVREEENFITEERIDEIDEIFPEEAQDEIKEEIREANPEESQSQSFDTIPDITRPQNSKIEINDELTLDLKQIESQLQDEEKKEADNSNELPVFDEEETEVQSYGDFRENDTVRHEKYGLGKIVKIVNYSDRCLLQVEFEEHGKRLLDPKIANLSVVK